ARHGTPYPKLPVPARRAARRRTWSRKRRPLMQGDECCAWLFDRLRVSRRRPQRQVRDHVRFHANSSTQIIDNKCFAPSNLCRCRGRKRPLVWTDVRPPNASLQVSALPRAPFRVARAPAEFLERHTAARVDDTAFAHHAHAVCDAGPPRRALETQSTLRVDHAMPRDVRARGQRAQSVAELARLSPARGAPGDTPPR